MNLDPIFGDRDDSYLYQFMKCSTAFTCGYCYGKLLFWLAWIVPGEWLKGAIALIFLAGIAAFYVFCKSAERRVFWFALSGVGCAAVVIASWIGI